MEPGSYGIDLAKYGPEEEAFLKGAITVFWEVAEQGEYDYSDNYRLAREGVDTELAEYEEVQKHGCCGYCDTTFGPSPGGYTYLYGFNYGH